LDTHAAPSTTTEHDLIERAQRGQRGAFSSLVRSHRQGVVNLVFRLYGDQNLAEDAAQETFIRAWQQLSRYRARDRARDRAKSTFRNWLFRIATNVAVDELRRRRETVDVNSLTDIASDDKPEASAEAKERSERVQSAILALPPASRTVLILREYEGLSYKEIAEVLDIPHGTVMSRLNYARQRLKERLSPYLEVL